MSSGSLFFYLWHELIAFLVNISCKSFIIFDWKWYFIERVYLDRYIGKRTEHSSQKPYLCLGSFSTATKTMFYRMILQNPPVIYTLTVLSMTLNNTGRAWSKNEKEVAGIRSTVSGVYARMINRISCFINVFLFKFTRFVKQNISAR